MRRLLLALAFCSSCNSCFPPGCQSTDKAGFSRVAAARLTSCVQNNPCTFLKQCFAESESYCLSFGYPKSCGQMEPEGSCGVNVR